MHPPDKKALSELNELIQRLLSLGLLNEEDLDSILKMLSKGEVTDITISDFSVKPDWPSREQFVVSFPFAGYEEHFSRQTLMDFLSSRRTH